MTGQRKRTVKLHKDSDAPTMNQQRHHHHMNSSSSSMQQQQHHHHHHHQLQQHDQRVSVAHVVHRWTVDEEARLRALVQEIGKGKWSKIAERLGTGRSASGVEQHWQIMIGQRKRNSSAKTPPYKPPATQQHIVSSSSSLSPSLCPTPAPSLGHPARPTFGDGDGIVAHRGESHGRSEHQLPRSQAHSPPSVIGPRSYPAGAVTVSAPPPSLEYVSPLLPQSSLS